MNTIFLKVSTDERLPDVADNEAKLFTVYWDNCTAGIVSYSKRYGFFSDHVDCSRITHWLEEHILPTEKEIMDRSKKAPNRLEQLYFEEGSLWTLMKIKSQTLSDKPDPCGCYGPCGLKCEFADWHETQENNHPKTLLDKSESFNKELEHLKAENWRLKGWKESAMMVFEQIDLNAIAGELYMTPGTDISKNILPGIMALKAEIDRYKKALLFVVDDYEWNGSDDNNSYKRSYKKAKQALEGDTHE